MDLVGYSIGGGTYCLIYVYMPSGSLEDRLHCGNGSALSWSQRVKVVLGSAHAIQYLHSCSPALIHGDVKSSNILLGEHLDPKLGDFGLARLCRNPSRSPGKTSTVAQTSTVRGTLAYLPDEYLKEGQLGTEIDVYSFGVVLLEVLTGRRALESSSQSKNIYLVYNTLLDVCTGLKSSSISLPVSTSPVPPHLSGPMPLRSDTPMDSLSSNFSKLGPQENTFCCSHSCSFPRPPSAATGSETPESERREGSWDTRYSSFHTPYDGVIINPVRQRLVEKMTLYEEGRILTSDLFSSGSSSNTPSIYESLTRFFGYTEKNT
ncbi:interleukin-1 receptor-associated kinase 1 isoform X2 [Silurus asotus]|uniref:Interleukin-1 receptor-associated kinase 1 isoform X2 n=1 Tax=Silurus asotus TaxID=30991 RepID=A0AAD5A6T5_SILAS|nr:interleukin-1 receptor-associated kinase 1 isoform X2 [Silurus asotus]